MSIKKKWIRQTLKLFHRFKWLFIELAQQSVIDSKMNQGSFATTEEELIESVRGEKALWDPNHQHYKDIDTKTRIWNALGEKCSSTGKQTIAGRFTTLSVFKQWRLSCYSNGSSSTMDWPTWEVSTRENIQFKVEKKRISNRNTAMVKLRENGISRWGLCSSRVSYLQHIPLRTCNYLMQCIHLLGATVFIVQKVEI